MIQKYTEQEIMDIISQDVIGWALLYEKTIMNLDWGDIKPNVEYVFMTQENQHKLHELWVSMLPKTKIKWLKAFAKDYRATMLSWDDLCYHPSYADIDCFMLVDTENKHENTFDVNKEMKK